MSIMTKKEIEAIECFDIGDNGCVTNKLPISKAEEGCLVYVEDFLALKKTLEKIIEAADVCLQTGFGDMLDELLSQYDKED